ncbi:MAG: hypothetical protein ACU0CI_09175 [Shimia sp.]
MEMFGLKEAALKAAIVLVPSYLAAYLTEKMVWVVPTLAAAGFFAGTVQLDREAQRRRVEEDDAEAEDGTQKQEEYQDYEPTVEVPDA